MLPQFEAELRLAVLNGACHRRLGTAEHLGSLGDAAVGGNGKKGLEISCFHLRLHAHCV
ncbi:hypothetical protein X772_32480 [Mesorhizobium sp. LSJC280B00]|nr:hypothetical protein X772_32480 [Mesorhizobium sp. LSJC280B00]